VQDSRSPFALDRFRLIALGSVLLVAAVASSVRPESLSAAIGGVLALSLVALRPEWGVGTLLAMLMMQYRNQYLWISQVLPSGSGLFSINNMLGLLLGLLMAYRLYRDGDWSFLQNRQVRLMLLITAAIVASALLHPINYEQLEDLGIRPPNQDPVRLMVSRALFLVLFVFFVRGPREVRLLVGIFLGLSLITAWTASTAALSGAGWAGGVGARVEEGYRAGGGAVITRVAGNPNRLAMISTLMIVLISEFSQSRRGRRWAVLCGFTILGLILTVFLTASRGGMIGLAAAGLLIFARRRGGATRLIYGGIVALLAIGLVGQLVPEQTWERLSNIPGISADSESTGAGSVLRRQYTLGIAASLAMENPLLGIGVGNWEKERFLRDPVHSTTVPHNSFMLTIVEGGVVTLGLYIVLILVTLRQLGELQRQPEVMVQAGIEGMDWLITGIRLAILSFMVFSLFGDLWETITFYFLFSVAAALVQRYGGSPVRLQPAV
jgi:hypothetical protein